MSHQAETRSLRSQSLPLLRHGLINLTFDNVNAIDYAQSVFAIEPSGVNNVLLKPDYMVLVRSQGRGRKVDARFDLFLSTPTYYLLALGTCPFGSKKSTLLSTSYSTHAMAFAKAGRGGLNLRDDAG